MPTAKHRHAARPASPPGRHYTPEPIARRIVAGCLDRWFAEGGTARESPVRILDPACGDGALLIVAFDELCARCGGDLQPEHRLGILRESLFGADLDEPAVQALRERLLECIVAPMGDHKDRRLIEAGLSMAWIDAARETIAANIRSGNSLTGPGFGDSRGELDDSLGIDWNISFPAAARTGGFDLVVGNPPYLRELNARDEFASVAESALGRKWRQPRMDLWYYFLHRGLDLLKPGGWLSFIVNSYWTASRGAERLRGRLSRETTLEEVLLLGNAFLFPGVSGRHLIFRLRRGRSTAVCRIIDAPVRGAAPGPSRGQTPLDLCADFQKRVETSPAWDRPQDALFQGGRLLLSPASPLDAVFSSRPGLGGSYEVRQGLAENPPRITAKVSRESGGAFQPGEGVFILSASELAALGLSPSEQKLLRPYYETAALGRFALPPDPTDWLLYLTRHTAPSLDALPGIRQHLERFRTVLDRRREVRLGRIAWWHLHWPREERLFLSDRILALQMGQQPQFVFAKQPTFVGFSVNLVLATAESPFGLTALTGILNSSLAQHWFARHAKQRGAHLDISGTVLREFPLPNPDAVLERRITEIVAALQQCCSDVLEAELNSLVLRLYGGRD